MMLPAPNLPEANEVSPLFDFENLPVIPSGLEHYIHQVGGHGSRHKSCSSANDLESEPLRVAFTPIQWLNQLFLKECALFGHAISSQYPK